MVCKSYINYHLIDCAACNLENQSVYQMLPA